MLFLPGVTPPHALPYMQPGSTPNVAPVVQAQSEAPPDVLAGLFKEAARSFAKEVGSGLGKGLIQVWSQ